MKKIKIFFIVIAVLLLGFIVFISARSSGERNKTPEQQQVAGKYDAFATCLKDKGAVFYGAFWCPHCNNNKALFGDSKDLLPYVECSTEDGQGQLQVCKDKKITGYPTWEFADGSRLTGEVQLATLAEKTACVLPQ
jgi:hypothetical protein